MKPLTRTKTNTTVGTNLPLADPTTLDPFRPHHTHTHTRAEKYHKTEKKGKCNGSSTNALFLAPKEQLSGMAQIILVRCCSLHRRDRSCF